MSNIIIGSIIIIVAIKITITMIYIGETHVEMMAYSDDETR